MGDDDLHLSRCLNVNRISLTEGVRGKGQSPFPLLITCNIICMHHVNLFQFVSICFKPSNHIIKTDTPRNFLKQHNPYSPCDLVPEPEVVMGVSEPRTYSRFHAQLHWLYPHQVLDKLFSSHAEQFPSGRGV